MKTSTFTFLAFNIIVDSLRRSISKVSVGSNRQPQNKIYLVNRFFEWQSSLQYEVFLMNSLPETVPNHVKVSFFEYQRKEWEKILASSKDNTAEEKQVDFAQHWESVSSYALARIKEIDQQLEQLKLNPSV